MRVAWRWAGYESDESADELAIMNVSQVSDGFIFNSCKAAVRLLRLIMFFSLFIISCVIFVLQ